jgi:RNA polymerase sigma-70 factor (ECF subfamily)
MDDPDLQLVAALKAGEDLALNELIQRHRQPLYFFVFRYLRDESAALDIVQETFVRAYFSVRSFKPRSSVKTWLYTIAANLAKDRLRWLSHRRHLSLDSPEGEGTRAQVATLELSPSAETAAREKFTELERAIADLPERLRIPLLLCTLEGQSHKDAGEILGISPKAVELRIYHAKGKLRAMLGHLPK